MTFIPPFTRAALTDHNPTLNTHSFEIITEIFEVYWLGFSEMVTPGNDWLSECTVPIMSVTQRGVIRVPLYISCHMSDQLPLHNQLFLNYIN